MEEVLRVRKGVVREELMRVLEYILKHPNIDFKELFFDLKIPFWKLKRIVLFLRVLNLISPYDLVITEKGFEFLKGNVYYEPFKLGCVINVLKNFFVDDNSKIIVLKRIVRVSEIVSHKRSSLRKYKLLGFLNFSVKTSKVKGCKYFILELTPQGLDLLLFNDEKLRDYTIV